MKTKERFCIRNVSVTSSISASQETLVVWLGKTNDNQQQIISASISFKKILSSDITTIKQRYVAIKNSDGWNWCNVQDKLKQEQNKEHSRLNIDGALITYYSLTSIITSTSGQKSPITKLFDNALNTDFGNL